MLGGGDNFAPIALYDIAYLSRIEASRGGWAVKDHGEVCDIVIVENYSLGLPYIT